MQQLNRQDFEPLQNQHFDVEGAECRFELTSVKELKGGDPAKREPFSLLFRGPQQPVYAQQLFSLSHEAMGRLDVFLVPVQQDDDGVLYEAIFA